MPKINIVKCVLFLVFSLLPIVQVNRTLYSHAIFQREEISSSLSRPHLFLCTYIYLIVFHFIFSPVALQRCMKKISFFFWASIQLYLNCCCKTSSWSVMFLYVLLLFINLFMFSFQIIVEIISHLYVTLKLPFIIYGICIGVVLFNSVLFAISTNSEQLLFGDRNQTFQNIRLRVDEYTKRL